MEFYSILLPNVIPIAVISAHSSYGLGFFTYIVASFCHLLGIENILFDNKLEKAKKSAMRSIENQLKALGADGIMDVHYQLNGLTYLVYGTAYKLTENEKSERKSKEKARRKAEEKSKREEEEAELLEYESYFEITCPNCDQQLSFRKGSTDLVCPWCDTKIDLE